MIIVKRNPDIPSSRNGIIQRIEVEESTWHKGVKGTLLR